MEPVVLGFLVIILLAVGSGIILAHNAAKRHAAEQKAAKIQFESAPAPTLERELEKYLHGPSHQISALKQKISHTIEQEVEKKLQVKAEEISTRYSHMLDEKEKSIAFVEKQFKSVSEQYQKLDTNFKELGEEKKQTEEVVRSMAEGVIMVNKKGEVILMNPAAERLLGVNKNDKIGKSIMSDLKEEQLISLSQEAGDRKEKEIVIQSQSDQTKKVLRASNAVIESEDGKTVGFVSVLSDVTKQKELDQLKSTFLSNISHDLRTPMVCIQGSLRLLADPSNGALNPQQEKFATIALNNINRLTRLINDLLDLSKLEAKQFSIRLAPFRLDEFIGSLSHEFTAWGKSKGVTIELDLPEPLEIEADQDRIGQVLTNLVGNALKFTPEGGKVTIDAKAIPQAKTVRIGIRDTGPGIAKKDCARIFEKFVQLDTPSLQGISGTGLGLSIVKEIVELHHGRVWVESEEGKGARFIFEIPVHQAAPAAAVKPL
ncbi:MAG: ATP-binding protein [Candidatus Omnitrophota bacterium]